jgi:hypothetical protein
MKNFLFERDLVLLSLLIKSFKSIFKHSELEFDSIFIISKYQISHSIYAFIFSSVILLRAYTRLHSNFFLLNFH